MRVARLPDRFVAADLVVPGAAGRVHHLALVDTRGRDVLPEEFRGTLPPEFRS
ncbi:MAG TPA: hypothetical protein GXZ60_11475 [Intrasporangiaceae bacterium]|nr:hypothetical protein [Intrasporangiaceae bacterium]